LAQPETTICFLQGNDISANFVQHIQHTGRATAPVSANAFANVVTGDFDHKQGVAASAVWAKAGKPKR
jgi:hypothetical protein